MRKHERKLILKAAAGLLAFAAAALGVAAAATAIVEKAKDECVVGEQADGYLGFVPGKDADSALRREVRDINQRRKVIYADLARESGVTIDVAAALAAEKLIGQASRGQCVRDQSGAWVEI